MQDVAQEKMEQLMHIQVTGWKCRECGRVTDSMRSRDMCTKDGHHVEMVKVQKTRWACRGCTKTVNVLDRELPEHCTRCSSSEFKQVPLVNVKTAPMEKDMLLPRGDEIKFLNQIPSNMFSGGARGFGWRPKESKDEYEQLNVE